MDNTVEEKGDRKSLGLSTDSLSTISESVISENSSETVNTQWLSISVTFPFKGAMYE